MPPKRKWNKLALATAVLFFVAWIGTNFVNRIFYFVAKQFSDTSPILSGLLEIFGIVLVLLVVTVLAIKAIRIIKVSGERGKVLSWIFLVLAILSILLWVMTAFRMNNDLRQLIFENSSSFYQ